MKSSRISIIISILVHAILFMSIAWINLDNQYDISEKVSIVLLEEKRERPNKPQRRNILTRKIPSLEIDNKQKITATLPNLNVTNRTPYLINDNTSPVFYDNVANIDNKINYVIENKNISYQNVLKPTPITVKENNIRPTSPKTIKVDGSKFVIDKFPVLEHPKVSFAQNNDIEAIQKFLDAVRKKIESNKIYPIYARSAGIEGTCRLTFDILSDGKVENIQIINSSGNELLDNSALESIHKSIPFPQIPSEIRLDRITINISLVFKLSQIGR